MLLTVIGLVAPGAARHATLDRRYDARMLWPQDPPQVAESTLVELGGSSSSYDPIPCAALGLLLVLVVGLRLWLGYEADPNWRARRITESARKGAARFATGKRP